VGGIKNNVILSKRKFAAFSIFSNFKTLNCNNKNSNNKAVIVPGKGKGKTVEIRIPT